ncbi:hypothetical protein BHE74_00044988 [Ensete ventricosum]|uniref:Legume lectin domain-containing protein n=1 Tax=Ensete ventricosum TaxID=4639 RepID=A0A427B050_ENSVE|nr:hypothetical protein B296_00018872 [Ensete ventricosum]RWW48904.1 hypothetical protein BHE74_00044988 [Ensete ventricosum]
MFALAMPSPASTFVVVVIFLFVVSLSDRNCGAADKDRDFCFSFDGLGKNRSFDSEFALYGDAEMSGSAVRIAQPAYWSSGRIAYRKAIRFFGTKPGFSSSFSFSISRGDGGALAFFLSPSGLPLVSAERDKLGRSTGGVAVRFGRSNVEKLGELGGSFIEIDVEGETLMRSSNLSGVGQIPNSGGEKLRSWIDYDGESKRIEVRLSQARDPRPRNSSISCSIDLSNVLWREAVFVGISFSSGSSNHTSSIYSWSFAVKHGAPYLMHSEPLNPDSFLVRSTESPSVHVRKASPWGVFMAMVFAAACGAMLSFFVMFVWAVLASRRPVAPVESPVGVAYGKIVSAGDTCLDNVKS